MKQTIKLLFLLLLLVSVCAEVTLLSGCKQCDDEEEMVMNPLVGTKWSAPNGEYLFLRLKPKEPSTMGMITIKGSCMKISLMPSIMKIIR